MSEFDAFGQEWERRLASDPELARVWSERVAEGFEMCRHCGALSFRVGHKPQIERLNHER